MLPDNPNQDSNESAESLLNGSKEARYSSQTQDISGNSKRINELSLNSRPIGNIRIKSSYSASVNDYVILADAAPASLKVRLPKAAEVKDHTITVKKIDASANTVTIEANYPEKIDGAATKSTGTQYVTFNVYSDGIAWHLI